MSDSTTHPPTTHTTDEQEVHLAGVPLPPGVQVTRYDSGMLALYFPMPGFLAAMVTLVPTRGEDGARVHVRMDRNLTADQLAGLVRILQAAQAWLQDAPAPEGTGGQQLLGA